MNQTMTRMIMEDEAKYLMDLWNELKLDEFEVNQARTKLREANDKLDNVRMRIDSLVRDNFNQRI